MSTTEMTLSEIRRRGSEALVKELGPSGYLRFITQFDRGEGDYTRDRNQWLANISLDELSEQGATPASPGVGSVDPLAPVDLKVVYRILRNVAMNGRSGRGTDKTITYSQLSDEYEKQAGVSMAPHGTWDTPLAEINRHALSAVPPLPPLSAVVILKAEPGQLIGMPGSGFWGSPGVAARPKDRVVEWAAILNRVYAANWPEELP